MLYALLAFFIGLFGTAIFNQGLFGNALSTTVVFLLLIPVIFAVGGELYKQKEEEQKRQAEFERKQRVKRGHLEDDLTLQQRILWNRLHKYRDSDVLTEHIINETKRKKKKKMWSWRYNKELKEKYYAEYCKTQSQTKYLMYTYYERNTDAEAKELQQIGLLDKYGNYTFWDNFPDNWKLSDEELEALDYEDDD